MSLEEWGDSFSCAIEARRESGAKQGLVSVFRWFCGHASGKYRKPVQWREDRYEVMLESLKTCCILNQFQESDSAQGKTCKMTRN